MIQKRIFLTHIHLQIFSILGTITKIYSNCLFSKYPNSTSNSSPRLNSTEITDVIKLSPWRSRWSGGCRGTGWWCPGTGSGRRRRTLQDPGNTEHFMVRFHGAILLTPPCGFHRSSSGCRRQCTNWRWWHLERRGRYGKLITRRYKILIWPMMA